MFNNVRKYYPGHGGMDGGAVAEDGTSEQDINLYIVYSCRDLAGFLGLPVVLTRTDTQSLDYQPDATIRQNKVSDIHARERIANEQNNPVFVSVHLNKFSDSSYSGAQTFWSQNHADGQKLAESIQQALTDGLKPSRVRSAKPAENSIYLMKQLQCPAVIVECGFLSNAEETVKLKDSRYQTQIAVCILSGYLNSEWQS
ncbi:MAG: N-acetylmuramoyl-L-alanine amidase [Butyricicoccus sp.]